MGSAVQSCTRYVSEPVVVRGVEFAPDELVQCLVGAANRDPQHFTDTDRFDLLRVNARDHLSLASGKHFCLGGTCAVRKGSGIEDAARAPGQIAPGSGSAVLFAGA